MEDALFSDLRLDQNTRGLTPSDCLVLSDLKILILKGSNLPTVHRADTFQGTVRSEELKAKRPFIASAVFLPISLHSKSEYRHAKPTRNFNDSTAVSRSLSEMSDRREDVPV